MDRYLDLFDHNIGGEKMKVQKTISLSYEVCLWLGKLPNQSEFIEKIVRSKMDAEEQMEWEKELVIMEKEKKEKIGVI